MKKLWMLCLALTLLMPSCGDYKFNLARADTTETENIIESLNTAKVENEEKTTEKVTKQPYNGTWYMTEWEKYPQQNERAQYYDETNALYIRVPVIYEENINGLNIKVEFFQDIYTLHSYIQCRVTITNTLDKWIEFNGKAESTPGVFNRNGTDFFNKVYYAKNFESIAHSNVLPVHLENGESFVNETVFYMSDTFFIEGYDYSFIVQVMTHDKEGKSENFELQIPIELCNPIESIPQTTEMFGEYYPLVEDTWHLSDWGYIPVKEFWYYEPLNLSEEARKTYVKLPLEYEETVDGVTIKVEFFQETYPIFAYIQARITVINESDKILSLNQGYKKAAGYFAANGELYCGAYESPDFDFVTTAAPYAELGKGDTFEAEVIYLFTNRFDADVKDHTYNVELQLFGDGWVPETRSISFPIEVLKTE